MAIEDLDVLKTELPELFEDMVPPLGDFEDEYIVVPMDDVEIAIQLILHFIKKAQSTF